MWSSSFSNVDRKQLRRQGLTLFSKLIRTKNIENYQDHTLVVNNSGVGGSGENRRLGKKKHKLTKCLSTLDLTSLGVGSCVGTGMYLVAGMVAKNVAGPGVIISFMIAALASIFSGACYAEFGVRVPNTTGSAYVYSYVTVGEFVAFVIGWNMILEYLIGTSACACALSACFDALANNAISQWVGKTIGTFFGRPPDFLAFLITILMTILTAAGAKKSLVFSNVLNIINLAVWVFVMTAGLFYVDTNNWTEHSGFLPYGWSGVLTGAATCFYAFIGFDIIATTGEEAKEPKKSIPLAIISSLAIILIAYVTSSMMITLIIPYDQIDADSALVEMFGQVGAPKCKIIVAIGALAGLTVSMFGSMFPMPRVIYAMAQDGLIFKSLAQIIPQTGTPVLATFLSGLAAALAALLIKLEVLVEMMSIGTLLAYTLVSTCVLILRYQPHSTNLVELLPQSLRTPLVGSPTKELKNGQMSSLFGTKIKPHELTHALESTRISNSMIPQMTSNTVTIRKITRNSSDSDETLPGEESDEASLKDDQFLVADRTENKFYGTPNTATYGGVAGASNMTNSTYIDRKLENLTYMCPALFPWIERGPATEESGMFVMKMVGVLYLLIILFDFIVVCSMHIMNGAILFLLIVVFFAMVIVLLLISRKPQNRSSLLFTTPGLPFIPAIAITVNIYLILKLSILTLVRFIFWMTLGFIMYFKYGIKNSQLEDQKDLNNIELTITNPEHKKQYDRKTSNLDSNKLGTTDITDTIPTTGRSQSPNIFDSINQVWDDPSILPDVIKPMTSNQNVSLNTNTEESPRRTAAESRALMANSRQTDSGSLFVDETEFPDWDD